MAAQFQTILKESRQGTLDLRRLDRIPWDELVLLTSYADICDKGIAGYEAGGPNCWSPSDDSETYLLLLAENKLKSKIKIHPGELDFSSTWDGRLPREKAVFQFVSPGNSAAVRLAQ